MGLTVPEKEHCNQLIHHAELPAAQSRGRETAFFLAIGRFCRSEIGVGRLKASYISASLVCGASYAKWNTC